uniref:ATP-dependent DNA helicase n=1 Tax=Octopus bimaculoides TaxID=37653 RepID=A0A0L8II04_OCTBM
MEKWISNDDEYDCDDVDEANRKTVTCPYMKITLLYATNVYQGVKLQQKLCNGTRLIVHKLMRNCIEANTLTGCGLGETVFIPCIPVIPSNVPFQFKWLQFPIRVSFAMSINKSQGQTLKIAGLQLQEPCFSHGQLNLGAIV